MGLPGSCRFCRPWSVEHPQSTEIGEVDRLSFLNLGRCVVAVASHQKFSKSYARSGPSGMLAVHGTTSSASTRSVGCELSEPTLIDPAARDRFPDFPGARPFITRNERDRLPAPTDIHVVVAIALANKGKSSADPEQHVRDRAAHRWTNRTVAASLKRGAVDHDGELSVLLVQEIRHCRHCQFPCCHAQKGFGRLLPADK